jgi:hypothetical protein
MASTTMRVFDFTKDAVDIYVKSVNTKRARKGKPPLNKTDVLALAVKNLTVEMGVQS